MSCALDYSARLLTGAAPGAQSRSGGQRFVLNLALSRATGAPSGAALLVYAEPSHTLLFAHVDDGQEGLKLHPELELAMAIGASRSSSLRYSVSLPFNPARTKDSRFAVVLRSRGKDYLIADGKVNTASFHFKTTYYISYDVSGEIDFLGSREHCCKNVQCGRMCITCTGAYFSCDLVNCTIECEWF